MLSVGRPQAWISVPSGQFAPRDGCLKFVLNPNAPICGSQALGPPFSICLADVTKDLTLCVLISEAAVLSSWRYGLDTANLKEITLN